VDVHAALRAIGNSVVDDLDIFIAIVNVDAI
jgi:hypothetical protein